MNTKEIAYIQDRAAERIEEILDALGMDYTEHGDYYQGRCACHNGDNDRSFYWATRTNHWKCTTKRCHEEAVSGKSTSVFGLVRGAMSNKENKQWSFNKSVIFVAKVLGLSNLKMDESTQEEIEISKIIKKYKTNKNKKPESNAILLSEILPKLSPDIKYYPSRGISKEIIDKYHISYCDDKRKMFKERAFIPILDPTGKFVVGWSGRSIHDKCKKCKYHHDPSMPCPPKHRKLFYEKWLHSKGFKKELYLYNYNFSKFEIKRTGIAVVVEGPGNIWKLEMSGIKNGVAIMGTSMSKQQRQLLQKAGALTLYIIFDNDNSGKEASNKLIEELNYYFRIIEIKIDDVNDIGDMSLEDIQEKIGKVIKSKLYGEILNATK